METDNSPHSSSEDKVSNNIQHPQSASKLEDTHIKSKKPNNIDFLASESTEECDEQTPNSNSCTCINHIIHALKYYAFLNTNTNKEGQLTFINFIKTSYKDYL
eukprot:330733_1